jgi:hypothetical protein
MEAEDLVKRDPAREASAREWTERAQGRSGATEPVPRPGYSIDPHADGNERTDDMIPCWARTRLWSMPIDPREHGMWLKRRAGRRSPNP